MASTSSSVGLVQSHTCCLSLQALEQIVEVLKVLPEQIASQLRGLGLPVPPATEERISRRRVEQFFDLPAPQVMECVEVFRALSQERISERSVEQFFDLRAPQVMVSVAVFKAVTQERISSRTVEQITDLPVPQVMECVEVFNSLGDAPDVPAPRFLKQIEDVIKVTSPEGVSDRIVGQTAGVRPFPVQSCGVFTVLPPERVSAFHVEQAVSWFDEKYKVFPLERPL